MNDYNPFSLNEKVIFVTGASSGIGKSIAIECSRMGAKVIISGRNEGRLDETFNELAGSGHIQIVADLSKEEEYLNLVKELPALDGIVHSAGIIQHQPFQFINKESLEEIFTVNFMAPTLMTNAILRSKKLNKGGSIVFISSLAGLNVTYPSGSSYSATKGAMNGVMRGMALDLAPRKVRVNSICPGMIHTNIMDDTVTEEQLVEDAKKYPLKRYGNPEEVGHAAVYLLSDASRWVTGSCLVIDGGLSIS